MIIFDLPARPDLRLVAPVRCRTCAPYNCDGVHGDDNLVCACDEPAPEPDGWLTGTGECGHCRRLVVA